MVEGWTAALRASSATRPKAISCGEVGDLHEALGQAFATFQDQRAQFAEIARGAGPVYADPIHAGRRDGRLILGVLLRLRHLAAVIRCHPLLSPVDNQ
jgi:hypothetical protein